MATARDFSSQSWPTGTSVKLINVPWDSAYKDVVQFDDILARDEWLDGQPAAAMATTRMTYIAPGQPILLPCPLTTAERFNYLFVDNPGYSITDDVDRFVALPRRYCYFITQLDYISPAVCSAQLQLDVWTTWGPSCRFKRAFVAQGHAAIANRNLWDGSSLAQITSEKMRRYLSAPEAVDAGGEYLPVSTTWTDLTKTASGEPGTFIGVMSSVDLSAGWGTATNPSILTASGSVQEGMLCGVQVVYFKTQDFLALLNDLRDAPWVARNIMQVWIAVGMLTVMVRRGTIHGHDYYQPTAGSPSDYFIGSIDVGAALTTHFNAHRLVAPKLMTAPYSFVELNAFEGSPLVLRPQRLSSLSDMILVANGLSLAPWDRIAVFPLYYGSGITPRDITYTRQAIEGNIVDARLHNGDFLDAALWISDLPRFSFSSDGYLQWLASGAHSRAWTYQNNDWNYHKTALERELAYSQGGENLDLARRQQAESQNMWQNQLMWRTATALADDFTADPIESIGNLTRTALSAQLDYASNDLKNRQFIESNDLARRQMDQNYSLQGYAMQGDYQQTLARLMATQRDAEITPPSVVGSAGGNGWNYAMGRLGFRTTICVPSPGQEAILFDYFTRFGYAINEMMDMPRDLRLMTEFTYWKLQESFIEGPIIESAKQAIRGIFERGTTVWSAPENIMAASYAVESNGINPNNAFAY